MLGLGVALARASLAADQIASGALVCPLKLAALTAYSYYLLGLPEVVDRPKIAMFRRLLIAKPLPPRRPCNRSDRLRRVRQPIAKLAIGA